MAGAAGRAAANGLRLLRRVGARRALPGGSFWLRLRLDGGVPETPSFAFRRPPVLTLLQVLTALETAARDPRVCGVVLAFGGSFHGISRALSVRRCVAALVAAGKPVASIGPRYDLLAYLVASAGTRVWLPESGSLPLLGLRVEQTFFRGLLDRLDVEPEVVRIGGYKAAGEAFTRSSMSEEQREQTEAFVDDVYEELVREIAAGRGLSPADVRQRIDAGPYTAPAAVEAGLVDGCRYPDQVEGELLQLVPGVGEPDSVPMADAATYVTWRASDTGPLPVLRPAPVLAYGVLTGGIYTGFGTRGIASGRVGEWLETVRRDDRVRGVVLRVDSPGGDATASDLVWRQVDRVRAEKPVVVSMGDVAASGGYYLASAADAILAEAGTLTGSIGVVGGKLNVEGLYRRLGIARESVERGARAGLFSEHRPFTPDERSAVGREMRSVYDLFLDRVARGRKRDRQWLEPLARGRVYSGTRAAEAELVDALGGPLEALALVRSRAGLRPDEPQRVAPWPARPRLPGPAALLYGASRARYPMGPL
ncbi:MAG: signal peptide peptidase SppA [Proteobacteria bacterium]|nr:signal peptide peptidase SppA [Pseudomonadota bacterium]